MVEVPLYSFLSDLFTDFSPASGHLGQLGPVSTKEPQSKEEGVS